MLDQTKSGLSTPPLLFEMIRSFVSVAKHLNLSHAVEELDSTRQTVRRHIETLENQMGYKLFEVVDRRYQLTPEGTDALATAQLLLAQGRLWLTGELTQSDGMTRLAYESKPGEPAFYFHMQQLPLSVVWEEKSALQRESIIAWARAGGKLDSDELAEVRPFWLVYRETESGFICVEIGSKSFFRTWVGEKRALSSIGKPLDYFPGGEDTARILQVPLLDVQRTRALRVDQVATCVGREPDGPLLPVVHQRLLMGGRFPDDSAALIVVSDKPSELRIPGLDDSYIEGMPEDVVIEFR